MHIYKIAKTILTGIRNTSDGLRDEVNPQTHKQQVNDTPPLPVNIIIQKTI